MTDEQQNTSMDTPEVGFAQHHGNLDLFIEECNVELRSRGLHSCEAQVFADYMGRAIFKAMAPTSARNQNGGPVILEAGGPLPLPWKMDDVPSIRELLNNAMKSTEEAFIGLCAKHKILRLTFAAFARMQSQTVQLASEMPNGRTSKLVMP